MDSMDNSKNMYCYMIAYRCLHVRRHTGSIIKYYDGEYTGRVFVDLPFQIKTEQDVLNAEKILLDRFPDDMKIERFIILSFQPIVPTT